MRTPTGSPVRSVICVHERFDATWPFTADHWYHQWEKTDGCEIYRTGNPQKRVPDLVPTPESVERLVILGLPVAKADLNAFTTLKECYLSGSYSAGSHEGIDAARARGITILEPRGDIQWGQTVAEYALGLTICALRRIPQTYNAMIAGHETWNYSPKTGRPGQRGQQFGDDTDFVSGTIEGKRVCIAGVGNIGGRYAKWCNLMGANVDAWDPLAPDTSFSLVGARRCFHLDELMKKADIFAPMVPLTDDTRGLITAEHIEMLPHGSLVIQVTRAAVCDTETLYRRVLHNELFLAADVFDQEPIPLDSPLLGRRNVVHTPHNAGRTIDANTARADDAIARFRPH